MIYYLISGDTRRIENLLREYGYNYIPTIVNNPQSVVATPNDNYWFVDESNIEFLIRYIKKRFHAKLENVTLQEYKRIVKKLKVKNEP